jgi:hypothetical protein
MLVVWFGKRLVLLPYTPLSSPKQGTYLGIYTEVPPTLRWKSNTCIEQMIYTYYRLLVYQDPSYGFSNSSAS